MPAIVSDPSSLTKLKLKEDLQSFGVELPASDSKKAVYVELYRQHVTTLKSEFSREFSSDDDDDTGSSKKRKTKKSSKKIAKVDILPEPETDSTNMAEIRSLTDDELAALLREHGVDIGPITDTTRGVYERKLEKVLASGDAAAAADTQIYDEEYGEGDDMEEDYSADDDTLPMEEMPQVPRQVPRQTNREEVSIRHRPPETTRYFDSPRIPPASTTSSEHSYTSTSTKTTHTTLSDPPPKSAVKPEAKKSSGMSICIQLGILAIVALIIFLVISNMEPARKGIDILDSDMHP